MAEKDYITLEEFTNEYGLSEKQVYKAIDVGQLPPFSVNVVGGKLKAWHREILRLDAIRKYLNQDISNFSQVVAEDMRIMPLGGSNGSMAKESGNFNNGNSSKKKLSGKKVPKSMRSSSRKSRVSEGFTYSNA